MKKLILLCGVLHLFQGCTTTVDSEMLKDIQPLVVIQSYIAPTDDIIKVRVTQTVSSFDQNKNITPEQLTITNAVVQLSDADGNEVTLLYNQERFNYEVSATEFTLKEGGTYFLKVQVAEKNYTARCDIPKEKVESFEIIDDSSQFVLSLKINFADIATTTNYYFVSGKADNTPIEIENKGLVTDTGANDEQISLGVFQIVDPNKITDSLNISVFTTDRNMYLWQLATSGRIDSGLFSETVVPPSNIIGDRATGVFGGYQFTEKKITLKSN